MLLEDPSKSHHAAKRVTANDQFDNRLIFGDNLLALKALEQEFAGKVKCVFIDPPYNTGSAFEHYDDGIEHSLWLSPISGWGCRLCLGWKWRELDFTRLRLRAIHFANIASTRRKSQEARPASR